MSVNNNEQRHEQQEDDDEVIQILAPGIQRNFKEEITNAFILNFLSYPLILLYFLITFTYVTSKTIPYEFIDEKFHINQTLTYLNGHWTQWDPKITTPPGLYILGWLNYKIVHIIPFIKSWFSDLTTLRLTNLFGGLIVLPIFILRPIFQLNAVGFWPVSLMCFPLLSTFYYLYYTDVWSTVFILWSLTVALTLPFGDNKWSIWFSSGLALISCLFRQTNIVWTGFIMIIVVERKAIIDKKFDNHTFNNFLKLFIHSIDQFNMLVLPYFVNFVLFALFLIWNRSITLGDKSNHSAGIHLVQLFYCFTFLTVLSLPLWYSKVFMKLYLIRWRLKLFRTIFELLMIMLVIRYFTKIHPFLLADNRHYTFYLFKKLIGNKHKLIKYFLMAPIYHFSTFVYMGLIKESELNLTLTTQQIFKNSYELPIQLTHISRLALVVCTIFTIVPSPLFEPRYYILPYFFWRIFVSPVPEPILATIPIPKEDEEQRYVVSSTNRQLLEMIWFLLIDLVTLIIFIKYSFSWSDEEFPQRIIW
ncbi:dolichyl-P-Glc:Glc(2)Man(9)GlcNAc(2)-PP-dolichol alpha-1,2- glucosyltransferase NDAI_0D02500 [Naumovozyma dairenensis CBS 421]|uniref:Dol-P-Glc:Glc(2)Man(9)GlcNAc(2)-PP-Dol alpha-1,2-glucosyltransferase n=1 Tax=Naumovozyma dairenensis (strain ATCC 10597 / BCRC 20456 / CBS 421 / NBRC 0211 / NRRL Y-12639) TaxID=1071378 RepID=G0W9V3_NAUDC|nr:hypothetical protein NDAI_0D02500 [Naumovozyma dairenensis CBS 421]CCD24564.1 hypothetical protein NDAI_0D02500 [Naumovozyma dairenensis CBS 421]